MDTLGMLEHLYLQNKAAYTNTKTKMVGGDTNYNRLASDLLKPTTSLILSIILRRMMEDNGITDKQYMIAGNYCLRKIKDVTNLDVVILKEAYEKLKTKEIGDMSVAKISKIEIIVVKFPKLGPEAAIKFYPKEHNTGFPTNEFSLDSLQKNGELVHDDIGNPYYNAIPCMKQYAEIEQKIVPNGTNGLRKQYNMSGSPDYLIDEAKVKENIALLNDIKKIYGKELEDIDFHILKLQSYLK